MHYCHCVSTSEYVIKKDEEKQDGLEFSGMHKLLVYADYADLLGKNIITTDENTSSVRC
jgi:hypothetical protein